ncbi:MAG: electron transport complex protein RnfA [Gammaproteobacteria bacterium]
MSDFAVIFIGACLVNNLIFDYLLGVSPAIAMSRKLETAIGMSSAMICVLTLAALISYPFRNLVLVPLGLEYLQTLSFIFIITLTVLLGEKVLQRVNPVIHERVAVFIPLTLINTSGLGVALLNIEQAHGLMGSLFFGLGAGAGFGLAIIMLSAMHYRIAVDDVPGPFQGAAITLITLGIIAMAFKGFTGIVSL